VTAGTVYTVAGITVVVSAPAAVAGTVEGMAVINETAAPYLDTWYGRLGWKWAYGKQIYAAPVLSSVWNTVKWFVKNMNGEVQE